MFTKSYSNFVRARSPEQTSQVTEHGRSVLSGEEVRRIYLEEVKDARSLVSRRFNNHQIPERSRKVIDAEEEVPLTNNDLFLSVQNNDVYKIKCILDKYPEKINITDDYGWSLLMIACQANSIDTAKELLKRGVDISVRDKAGNSAQSLVIKNKNYALADVLLEYREPESKECILPDRSKRKLMVEYACDVCNKSFPDKEEHLASTLHNISASKGKKITASYVIPASNRGYQLMLKGGWDRDSGLGRDGSGKKYPIKTVQKKDRKGLGHKKQKCDNQPADNNLKTINRKMYNDNIKKNRSFEINFRREFY